LWNAKDAKDALESLRGKGYQPLTLFSKASTGTCEVVKFTAKGSFFGRFSLFFKAIAALYDLGGPAKFFIGVPWAVFCAILGRIMVTCEVETAKRIAGTCVGIDNAMLNDYLGRLQDLSVDHATLDEALVRLTNHDDRMQIEKIFCEAGCRKDSPISHCKFDNLNTWHCVVECEYVDSHIPEALLAIAICFGIDVRFYVIGNQVIVLSTVACYGACAASMARRSNCCLFVDTTECGKGTCLSVCPDLDELEQAKYETGHGKTISIHAAENSQNGSMQCVFRD
jgi:hypothetical protein